MTQSCSLCCVFSMCLGACFTQSWLWMCIHGLTEGVIDDIDTGLLTGCLRWRPAFSLSNPFRRAEIVIRGRGEEDTDKPTLQTSVIWHLFHISGIHTHVLFSCPTEAVVWVRLGSTATASIIDSHVKCCNCQENESSSTAGWSVPASSSEELPKLAQPNTLTQMTD